MDTAHFRPESRPMVVINPAFLIAIAALISSVSALIWSLRRKA